MTSNTSQDIRSQSLIPKVAEQSQIPFLDVARTESILLIRSLYMSVSKLSAIKALMELWVPGSR